LFRYDNAVDKNIVADRFMYLPCLGICLLVGHWVEQLLKKTTEEQKTARIAVTISLMLAVGLLGAKTFAQTQIWRASIPFWSYVVKHYPKNAMAYGNRGEAYKDIGQYDLAMEDFNKSISVDPAYAESYWKIS